MKSTNRFVTLTTLVAFGFALSFIAAGCKNPQNVSTMYNTKNTPQTPEANPFPGIPGSNEMTSIGIPPNEPGSHSNWVENSEQFKSDTVHFAFDSSVIRSSEKPKISQVADYLKGNPQNAVRVEGNCDERGTAEYNRSLGERRALAGREELVRLGIEASRVDTISYGEDKPVATGHDESAWKQNRRDDFILLTPPAGK